MKTRKTAGNLANSVVEGYDYSDSSENVREGQGHIRRPAEKEMLLR